MEGYRLKREPGASEFRYSATPTNQKIQTIYISNAREEQRRPGLKMRRSGDQWEAVLEGNTDSDAPERLAVHSGPLPEDLIGATFVPHRPDIASTRVGERGLTLIVPARQWEAGKVVGRLETSLTNEPGQAEINQSGLMQLGGGKTLEEKREREPARGRETGGKDPAEVAI